MSNQRDLDALATTAARMEEALRETAAVLDAIEAGDLLTNTPADEHEARLHSTGVMLLDMLRARVRQIEDAPGTDLSIRLSVMAQEARV